jgi:uncharacterized membrane protein YhhN
MTKAVPLKALFLLLFGLFMAFDLAAIGLDQEAMRILSKPILMPALAGYVFSVIKTSSSFKRLLIMALFFSWAGDILLLMQGDNATFFLLGLSAFLIAHIYYISFFHRIRVKEKVRDRWWWLPFIAAYYAVLIAVLFPHLGGMKIPVLIYGLVISFMLLQSVHMLYVRKTKTAGQFMAMGAALFILSDSILAVNKFYSPFEEAGIAIMFTYGLAQVLLVTGAVRYIQSVKSGG